MSATEQSQAQSGSSQADSEIPSRDRHLIVATWNVQYGADVDGAIHTIESHAALADADIVLLQEMDEAGTARIADTLGASYVYQSGSVHRATGRDFGNAVVSRHRLSNPATVQLPHQSGMRGETRIAVGCDIEHPGGVVHAFSVHTEVPTLPLRYRVRQFATVADACSASSHSVVGGDFNTMTRRGISAAMSQMRRVGLEHVHPGQPTLRWPSQTSARSLGLKLDHLFVKGFAQVDAGVISSTAASDHLPLWAELNFSD